MRIPHPKFMNPIRIHKKLHLSYSSIHLDLCIPIRIRMEDRVSDGTDHGVSEITGYGVADLTVSLMDRPPESVVWRERLDSGVLFHGEWTILDGMASLRLFLTRRGSQCETRFIERQPTGDAPVSPSTVKAFPHI